MLVITRGVEGILTIQVYTHCKHYQNYMYEGVVSAENGSNCNHFLCNFGNSGKILFMSFTKWLHKNLLILQDKIR